MTITPLLSDKLSAPLAEEEPISDGPVIAEDHNADWRQTIRIGDDFLAVRKKTCTLLETRDAVWNGSLGQIDATEH